LWVNVEQGPAIRLYAKAGFAPEGEPMRDTCDLSRVLQGMAESLRG